MDTHDENNYEVMSPAYEAEIIAHILAQDGLDTEHQGNDTILFTDDDGVRTVSFRMIIEEVKD
jgi:hypothetical protein